MDSELFEKLIAFREGGQNEKTSDCLEDGEYWSLLDLEEWENHRKYSHVEHCGYCISRLSRLAKVTSENSQFDVNLLAQLKAPKAFPNRFKLSAQLTPGGLLELFNPSRPSEAYRSESSKVVICDESIQGFEFRVELLSQEKQKKAALTFDLYRSRSKLPLTVELWRSDRLLRSVDIPSCEKRQLSSWDRGEYLLKLNSRGKLICEVEIILV